MVSIVSLAAEMGISRSPVRTAIERLQAEGLVTQTTGGAVIEKPSRKDLLDALAVRGALESLAATLAAPQLSDSDIAALHDAHARFETAIVTGELTTAQRLDLEFHQLIQTGSDNPTLIESLNRVQARVILATYTTHRGTNPVPAIHEHAAILGALVARDGLAAGRAAAQHLDGLAARIKQHWASSSVLNGGATSS